MEGEDFSATSTPMQYENELDVSARDLENVAQKEGWKLGIGHLLNHLHMTVSFLFLFMAFRFGLRLYLKNYRIILIVLVQFRTLSLQFTEKLDCGLLHRYTYAFVSLH